MLFMIDLFLNNTTLQGENNFDSFLSNLRKLVKKCDYAEMETTLLRDRIVVGISNNLLKKKLLKIRDLTLDDVIKLCTVDASKGFWQLKLSEESSKLTTFWTPFGRYRWNAFWD